MCGLLIETKPKPNCFKPFSLTSENGFLFYGACKKFREFARTPLPIFKEFFP
jgi:hypothetical protein